jgi:hypothetical protein
MNARAILLMIISATTSAYAVNVLYGTKYIGTGTITVQPTRLTIAFDYEPDFVTKKLKVTLIATNPLPDPIEANCTFLVEDMDVAS